MMMTDRRPLVVLALGLARCAINGGNAGICRGRPEFACPRGIAERRGVEEDLALRSEIARIFGERVAIVAVRNGEAAVPGRAIARYRTVNRQRVDGAVCAVRRTIEHMGLLVPVNVAEILSGPGLARAFLRRAPSSRGLKTATRTGAAIPG